MSAYSPKLAAAREAPVCQEVTARPFTPCRHVFVEACWKCAGRPQYNIGAVVPWPVEPQKAVAVDSSARFNLTSPKLEMRGEMAVRSSPR